MNFIVNIQLGHAAMQTGNDVARALREVADKLDDTELGSGHGGTIVDANGNRVGAYRVRRGAA